MTRALCSLCRPSAKSALTHRRWLVVGWPAAIVRPLGGRGRDGSAISFPLLVYTVEYCLHQCYTLIVSARQIENLPIQ